ncbi:MAG TPA: hypothetical protein VJX67_00115 [Blastocatellia bacterium]|nr:hypothetical protein [Blastocatellia bacterium]
MGRSRPGSHSLELSVHSRKYARAERERRFLLDRFPPDADVLRVRHIADRYIDSTNLRLRKQEDSTDRVYKLMQKIHLPGDDYQQGFITTMYLTETEFDIFSQIPASSLRKTRYSVPVFGIDVLKTVWKG